MRRAICFASGLLYFPLWRNGASCASSRELAAAGKTKLSSERPKPKLCANIIYPVLVYDLKPTPFTRNLVASPRPEVVFTEEPMQQIVAGCVTGGWHQSSQLIASVSLHTGRKAEGL